MDRRCRNCKKVKAPRLRGFKDPWVMTKAGTVAHREEFPVGAKGVQYKEVVGTTACEVTGQEKHPDDYCDKFEVYR